MDAFISHAAVYAKDIEKTKNFYVKYFGGKANKLYQNNEGFSSYFITFSSGARLEIMHHKELIRRISNDKDSGWSHLAFSVGSKENIINLTKLLESDGFKIFSQPRITGDGYFESNILDPDGNSVEITE